MKHDYEQIFKRDSESGKIVIEISLNDYLEFFHEWDNAVFKKRDMHPELAEFLEECSRDIPPKEALDVRFYLADEPRDPEKEEVIRSSYRNYFDAALSFEEGEVKRTVYGSGVMLFIALILLSVYTLLAGRSAGTVITSALLESLLIGGWVLTWEAFHRVAIDMIQPLRRKKMNKRLQGAAISFRYSA